MPSVRCPYMFVSKLTLNIVRPKADVLVHTITGVVLPFSSIKTDRGALFQRPTEVLKPHSARALSSHDFPSNSPTKNLDTYGYVVGPCCFTEAADEVKSVMGCQHIRCIRCYQYRVKKPPR